MGLKEFFSSIVGAVDTEYDRRVKAASNVRAYAVGGHGHHADPAAHEQHADPPEEQPGEPQVVLGGHVEPADVAPAVSEH